MRSNDIVSYILFPVARPYITYEIAGVLEILFLLLLIFATLTNGFMLRNWIAQMLIRLAGRVAVMDVDIEIVED